MGKKIIILLAVIMLIITSFAVFASPEIKQIKSGVISFNYTDDEVDVPIWKIGDSWTYDVIYSENFNQQKFIDLNIKDLKFEVIDEDDQFYIIEYFGNASGRFGSQPIIYPLDDAKIQGEVLSQKSDISLARIITSINGVKIIGPISIPFDIGIIITLDPPFTHLSFPLYVGKEWTTSSSDIDIDISIEYFGGIELFHESYNTGPLPLSCTNIETVSTPAGIFEAFKISSDWDLLNIYYDPTVANIIKIFGNQNLEEL